MVVVSCRFLFCWVGGYSVDNISFSHFGSALHCFIFVCEERITIQYACIFLYSELFNFVSNLFRQVRVFQMAL
jgi:hypothetical protein